METSHLRKSSLRLALDMRTGQLSEHVVKGRRTQGEALDLEVCLSEGDRNRAQ